MERLSRNVPHHHYYRESLLHTGNGLQSGKTLGQLDIGSPGVEEKGDRHFELGPFGVRPVESHSLRLQLLAQGLQSLDFEADVIDGAPFRAGDLARRRGKRKV